MTNQTFTILDFADSCGFCLSAAFEQANAEPMQHEMAS